MEFKYTIDNKRYHTLNYYLRTTYGKKVAKIALDANYNCPNRDGTKAHGGCIFCNAVGSSDFSEPYIGDLEKQYLDYKIKYIDKKWPDAYTIAYFQAFSNTYGPLDKIQRMCELFIDRKEVVELSIATRADCLTDEIIEYLDSLTHKKTIWLELGLQSSNNKTLNFLNRAETFEEFAATLKKLEKTNIKICIHLINGIVNETKEDMLKTIKDINKLHFHGVKFHMLEVLKRTKLSFLDLKHNYQLIDMEQYLEILIEQLELLKPEIIIHRICGDAPSDELVKPKWVRDKLKIRNTLDKLMKAKNTWQGKKYEY